MGVAAGVPMAVGPVLAAALVGVTYALARRLSGRADVALVAALLSVLCAALRYHTADTMSHGLSALLFATALLLASYGRSSTDAGAGLATGWLVATRPFTGAVALVVCLSMMAKKPGRWPAYAISLVPGLALLALHQEAATGSLLGSAQLRYYALADGPPGCFRYGFGEGIGCRFEHGDFVRARLGEGFGVWAALGTTLRRLWYHALDLGNFEPFALLLLVALAIALKRRKFRPLALGTLGVVIAYAPFYFDGNYPAGGARLLADALPLEHILLAHALVDLGIARWMPTLSLAGFALHGSFGHRALAEREGGRPMFETAVLERAGIARGLVLVDTDHGFNLGHMPERADPQRNVIVARFRGDDTDRLLWERLERPPVYRYVYLSSRMAAAPQLAPYVIVSGTMWRFEAEHAWPPLAISGGWAHPEFPPHACASARRALRLHPSPGQAVRVEVDLTAPKPGAQYDVVVGWTSASPRSVTVAAEVGSRTERLQLLPAHCASMTLTNVSLSAHARLVAVAERDSAALDFVELRAR
jgi:hypothetical protein